MRSVILSNSVLIVAAPPYSLTEDDVVIRDQVNEILELTPTVPKLQKLGSLLRDLEYDEGQEDDSEDPDEGDLSVSHWVFQFHRFGLPQPSEAEKVLLPGCPIRNSSERR
jgi:hypothetical protein